MRHYGLIGHPLGHSYSKAYFTAKFEAASLDCDYQNYDLEDISVIKQSNLNGFNVTIPYKETIIPYLDELDPVAEKIGAVNTVKVLPNGELKGYNTDVIGFEGLLWSILPKNNVPEKALILGTGGASKAVQYILKIHHLPFHLVSRDSEKGDYTYAQLTTDIITEHLLIINTTPLGTFPNVTEAPPIPYGTLSPSHTLIDLIYNPEETVFLRHGREHGAKIQNGLAMLHTQAEASWKIWNDSSLW